MYIGKSPCCTHYFNRNASPYFNANLRNTALNFASFSGIVTGIEDFYLSDNDPSLGCNKLISLQNTDKLPVNFIISPQTYFVDHKAVDVGDSITGFYDANAATVLIYPPQYRAIVIAKNSMQKNVTVAYFNDQLISSDGNLKLNVTPSTEILLTNDQPFNKFPGNRNLIVTYGPTTKSIPAQTSPYRIIVLC